MSDPNPHILGVDIGGTFTDFVLLRDGEITVDKRLSTPDDPARALLAGVEGLGAPHTLIHGTTVATNALLEQRGAATALITTAGFADVLAIGRGTRPALYDLNVQRPPPLVPAAWRLELPERLAADGSVVLPLDTAALDELVERLAASEIEAVAICLLHSYRNPAHEQQVAQALAACQRTAEDGSSAPRFFVCASSDVLPEYREYERTSTTVVNAYVAPILGRYLGRLETELAARGVASLRIMASDGGSMTAQAAPRLAARTTLSGPAGGVVGARAVAQQAGFSHIISFDMGGTSTDVALCADSLPQTSASSVGGMPVRLPSIDIHTVGAGGGSLARLDAGGALRVGPQSAGADPGPACYGRGDEPTVTDANLLLGRLRADAFLGGDMSLDDERAADALRPLAEQSGLELPAAALGVLRVANAAMERAIRAISVERGHDPRDFVLVAFGGAGPLHAAYLAAALGMQRVLVPRYPGVLSALGMLTADITRDYVHIIGQALDALTPADLSEQMRSLARQGWDDLRRDAGSDLPLHAVFALDLRYVGQSHELSTPLAEWSQPDATLEEADLREAAARFHQLHEQQSGHAMPEHPIEVVSLRLKMIGATGLHTDLEQPPSAEAPTPTEPPAPRATVQATLAAEDTTPQPTALYERGALAVGQQFAGPAIIVQLDTTTVVPPGWQARVEPSGHLLLTTA
jgi:N-methylhydantoinase A